MASLPALEIERAVESHSFWLKTCLMVPNGVYALLAMEEGESDFQPDAKGDKVGGVPKAFSIFQWHLDRVEAMLKGTGIDVRSADHMHALKAAYYELRHSEHVSWGLLMKSKTVDEAVQIGVRHFERPGNPNSDIIKRTSYAYYWKDYFENKLGGLTVDIKKNH